MKRLGRQSNNQRHAFTLIEILVVVVLIGVLVALVVPQLFGKKGKAQRAVAAQKLKAIESSISMFQLSYDRFPTSLDELVNRPTDIEEDKWESPTLKAKELKDPWGNDYVYVFPGTHGTFDLYSYAADGQEGGEGDAEDVVNW
ncbi:type II secretion system major pseudopilin GspG [Poriferisphaera sp. WC338]|uniref:type II secretion system major pseudopilin GspG n=1 Tax=Poriferisphaera sp. WC338 TaxID=3425129 RepID=UPI003D815D0E